MASHALQTNAPDHGHLSWLEIDLARLDRNLAALRRVCGAGDRAAAAPRLCAAIKKNAYGLGAAPIAHRLTKAGADMLAVYSPGEAEDLVKQSVSAPLLLLMPLRKLARTDVLYRHAVAEKLHLSVHDPAQVEELDRIGQTFGIRLPIHLFLDTGMSRSGLNLEQFRQVMMTLDHYRHLRLAGVYSHLATADSDADYAYHQLERLERALEEVAEFMPAGVTRHLANTFGTLRDPRFHLDMVRPGLGLFGYGADQLEGPCLADAPMLEPIVRWLSRIIHVQRYPHGSTVGYGNTHTLRRDSVLAIVPVGYGDGYPLALSNKAMVRVYPPERPPVDVKVLGRVNMDQIVIDLTDLGLEAPAEAMMHGIVEVIGADPAAPNALPRLAEQAGVHCYEMLCRLGANLPRYYVR